MTRRIVGPFNRVEGDLEVHLDIEDGAVRDAWVRSPLFRGFEKILESRDPRDALTYTPRICGICSVSQSAAAARALADLQGTAPPPNGELAGNLILATENVADHLTHFYLFFMPDFCRDAYKDAPWFDWASRRFKAVTGAAASEALRARAEFMHILGMLAGKWPHTLSIQPGGTTRSVAAQEKVRLKMILAEFRRFLESALFGDPLERVTALSSAAELEAWAAEQPPQNSDFRAFLHIADQLDLAQFGRATDRFMSFGAYPDGDRRTFARGVFYEGAVQPLDPGAIREDAAYAWLAAEDAPPHPFEGRTDPDADADAGYTWCKAPRLDGQVVEVGALARQAVDGHPLIRDLIAQSGGNVRNRVVARLLEIARVVVECEKWVARLRPNESFCDHAPMPEEGRGFGLTEAARGALGHWLVVEQGKIANYQIIAPTTWNFSPRDRGGTRGALETALLGAPAATGEADPVMVQHIVRSFDPCMVCTVH